MLKFIWTLFKFKSHFLTELSFVEVKMKDANLYYITIQKYYNLNHGFEGCMAYTHPEGPGQFIHPEQPYL